MLSVDGAELNYSGLPERHRETVRLYLEAGVAPGAGWKLILAHDLGAVIACDAETVAELPRIYRWLHNYAPSASHGSAERVRDWMVARQMEWRAA